MKNLMYIPKTFENWTEFHSTYRSSCYCTSVVTDCESYVIVEAIEQECLDALTNDFIELGFTLETKNYEETKSRQRRN